MSRLDELPPDQRAALSLLLRQGKSYGELAGLLGIPEQALHDRAHAALAVLAPRQARELTPERRKEIGDYLLGQQPAVAERLATRSFLAESEPARAWAGELIRELAPLASRPLPDVPAATAAGAPEAREPGSTAPAPADAGSPRVTPPSLPSSRLGGALLLAGLLAAVIVAVILISNGGSTHRGKNVASSTATKSAGSGGGPKVEQRLALRSPNPGSTTVAVVEILSEAGKRAFYIGAENLPPSRGFYYAIWLYNSPSSSEALSRSPSVGSNERLAGGALLPANAGNYREMLITRETASRPTHPGSIVLRGPFSLGG
jgi:hypothetical protein